MPKYTRFIDEDAGLGRYVQELQHATSEPQSRAETPISSKKGTKRSRDGSPKTPIDSSATKQTPDVHKDATGNLSTEKADHIEDGERVKSSGNTVQDNTSTSENEHPEDRDSSVGIVKTVTATSVTSQNGHSQKIGKPSNDYGQQAFQTESLFNKGTAASGSGKPRPQYLERLSKSLLPTRKSLPIWAHKADIRWSLRHSDILLLVGETGSGKSTQVPQFLITEPWFKRKKITLKTKEGRQYDTSVGGVIAITEPRRVAATSLAHRVAKEQGSHLGSSMNDKDTVGYSVRFDHVVPKNAKIKFLTEGMLLQEMQQDPALRQYSAVIIDEIHERSVDVDLLSGFLRNIIQGDKKDRGGVPLKLIIMSATANMEGIRKFFSLAPANDSVNESLIVNGHTLAVGDHGSSEKTLVEQAQHKVNGDRVKSSPKNRRLSDVSESSWEGIASDDDTESQREGTKSDERISLDNGIPVLDTSVTPRRNERSTDVAVHYIKGRQHPVKVLYTPAPVADYMDVMLRTIFTIHTTEPLPGDILAFLTGQEEIETLQQLVEQNAHDMSKNLPKIKVLTLYGQLPIEQQQEAFAATKDKRTRKVVIATNIAETSVTVPGVRFVIDSGKAKVKQYRSHLGLESLLIKPISKSSAIQRKGRAGREAPGKCYRLYTEAEYLKLPETDLPEILRSNVSEAVLRMKANGVGDIMDFPLMDPPNLDSMEKALVTLHRLGAIDDECNMTNVGNIMARFPLAGPYARVLIAAAEPDTDCLLEAIDIISVLTDEIFIQPKSEEEREVTEESRRDLIRREGDILTYLTTIQKYCSENTNRSEWCAKRSISSRNMQQALKVRKQLRQLCIKIKLLPETPSPDPQPFIPMPPDRVETLLKCFLKAFSDKTASLQPDGSYSILQGRNVVAIHPSSVLYGQKTEAIMFLDHVFTQKNYAKKVSRVQLNWIVEAASIV